VARAGGGDVEQSQAQTCRGADMVEYWHWNTLHFGAETFWAVDRP
jgi:hypothetical protein